jgi:hypothetical protein
VLIGSVLAVVVALGLGAVIVLTAGSNDGAGSAAPSGSAGQSTAAGPVPGDVQVIDDVPYTVQRVQVDDTCAGHAYGDVATYFAQSDCTGLSRALYSVPVDGGSVVVSVSRVAMPDTASARALRALADTNGSGNVSDLLREGIRFDNGPEKLSGAEYDSAVSGATVTIVESAWMDPSTGGDAAVVDRVAHAALALRVPPLPAG